MMQPNYENEVSVLKVPPHSLEAEQAVLGGALQNKDAVYEIAFLTSDDFYLQRHRVVFDVMMEISGKGEILDIVTVAETLEKRHLLDEAGGVKELALMVENTPSAANIKAYAEIVRKRALLRNLLTTTTEINDLVFSPEGKGAYEILDAAASKIYNLADEKVESNLKQARSITNEFLEELDYRYHHQGQILGLKTGFEDLDSVLNGMEGGDLVIVAGRPAMGKTSFAVNMAEHATITENKTAAVFSLEMPSKQLVQRIASGISRVFYSKFKTGKIEDQN